MANMVVSGAGTAAANGTYIYVNDMLYQKADGWKLAQIGDPFALWHIANPTGVNHYRQAGTLWDYYPSPDLAPGWIVNGSGAPPPPTVTAEGGEPEPPTKKFRYKPISQLTGRIGQLGT